MKEIDKITLRLFIGCGNWWSRSFRAPFLWIYSFNSAGAESKPLVTNASDYGRIV